MTQEQEILLWLQQGHFINQLLCYDKFSKCEFENCITDLSGRIHQLRKKGHNIKHKEMKFRKHTFHNFYLEK